MRHTQIISNRRAGGDRTPLLGLLLGALCASNLLAPVRAGDDEPAPEITVLVGLRGGTSLFPESVGQPDSDADAAASWGIALDFPVRPDARVELFFDRQVLDFAADPAFDLTVDYLHAGGVYEPPRERLRPFVAVALGLTRFAADGASNDDALEVSGSIGGGVKVPLGRRLALRLEARGYATFGNTSFAVACGPGCSVNLTTDGWYQLSGRIGLAVRL